MKKEKLIVILLIGIMFLVSIYLFISPLQSETSQSINESGEQEPLSIQPNETVKQKFKCKINNLNKITFQSYYREEGFNYHVVVKLVNQIIADKMLSVKMQMEQQRFLLINQDSLNKEVTLLITNTMDEEFSVPKEKDTKNKMIIKYFGDANNYFFAWYPLFVAAILFVVLSIM